MATSSRRPENPAATASGAKPSRATAPTPSAPSSGASMSPVPPLPALTLRQVQYFVALAHSRSFTQAAQALSVTQPALTAAIRQIEFLLGGRLFERSAHRLTLTEGPSTT
mgnify:CR=1 FL=1